MGAKEYLGIESDEDRYSPIGVQALAKIGNMKMIACGPTFSGAISMNNDVFMWGDNKYGQLGLGESIKFVKYPYKHPFFSQVSKT